MAHNKGCGFAMVGGVLRMKLSLSACTLYRQCVAYFKFVNTLCYNMMQLSLQTINLLSKTFALWLKLNQR